MTSQRILNAYIGAFLAFMFAPLVLMIIASFNDASPPSVTDWRGLTGKWYAFFWMSEAELRADPVLRALDRDRLYRLFWQFASGGGSGGATVAHSRPFRRCDVDPLAQQGQWAALVGSVVADVGTGDCVGLIGLGVLGPARRWGRTFHDHDGASNVCCGLPHADSDGAPATPAG